jgi:hypothetical protein
MFDSTLLCQKYDEILWWFMDYDAIDMVDTYLCNYAPSTREVVLEKLGNFVQFMNWYRRATDDDLDYRNHYFHVLIVQDIYKHYELFEDFYEHIDSLYKKDKQRLEDIEFLEIFGL